MPTNINFLLIQDMKKMLQNDIESYFLEKYNKYLKNIEQKSKLDHLDTYYEESSSSSSEDEDEEEKLTEEIKEDIKEQVDIPGFIRGYSKVELEQLMNLFVNPGYDYSNTDKIDLEIQYKNYLEGTSEVQ